MSRLEVTDKNVRGPLRELVTVLVVGNPSPTHPSTALVDETLASLQRFLGVSQEGIDIPIVISHDGLPIMSSSRKRRSFAHYLVDLKSRVGPHVLVCALNRRRGLTRNIELGLRHVRTPFVLIVQHDLPFIRPVNLRDAVAVLTADSRVKHLRFNLLPNSEAGWDSGVPPGLQMDPLVRSGFHEEIESVSLVPLMQTLNWSDNNHLCDSSYYSAVVFPVVGLRPIPPERAMIPLVNPATHAHFGTYIWAGLDAVPVIAHSDGRRYSESHGGRLLARFSAARRLRHRLRILLWRFSFRYSRVRFALRYRVVAKP